MLNLMEVVPGQVVRLKNGTEATVVENVGDGMWLNCKVAGGDEELIFCEDIASVTEQASQ